MYQKRNILDVLTLYLGDYTKQFYLREISSLTNIPLKTVQTLVSRLEKRRIIKSSIKGKHKYFKLNLNNIHTKFYLLQAEIQKTLLFLNKYPLFKTFLKELHTNMPLLVFGSFAKFRADKDSDVDLLTLSKERLPLHLLPYNVHKIELSENSFHNSLEKQIALIKEIEETHVILNNHSFYVNLVWDYYGK